jgi:hypothetical protein
MNYVENDYGNMVIAVGAPGSLKRLEVQYPKLISELNDLYYESYDEHGRRVDLAVEMIRRTGIVSESETSFLLKTSKYGDELPGSVTSMVCGFNRK